MAIVIDCNSNVIVITVLIVGGTLHTKTHQIVPPFKNFLEGTCPLIIQYTE